jgi:cellulose synthase/poly-beta-1,6-N-acetylglucosamine synthase-like glycosyltransferase
MKARPFSLATFWLGLAALAYTFVGYGLLMRWLASRRARTAPPSGPATHPSVTAIVVAHNEEASIVARVQNLLASEYPADRLHVLVVSDGSTDATVRRAQAVADPRVAILTRLGRSGKAACLNAAFRQCSGDLVVLTDARQDFAADTIRRLAAHFADPRVGAVSGALEIKQAQTGIGTAVDTYWRHEKVIRAAEAQWDSCIGCTGAVYAVRRALFEPIPEDTLLDDVVIPMQIAIRGYRVLHDPTAVAHDPQALEPSAERARKRRTLAGNFQMLFRYPHWLLPWRNRLWWQLLSHKYLRIFAPVFLAQVLLANLALLARPFYRATFFAQLVFYTLSRLGAQGSRLQQRLFSLPAGFVFLNLTTIRAFWHYLRARDAHRWKRASNPSERSRHTSKEGEEGILPNPES